MKYLTAKNLQDFILNLRRCISVDIQLDSLGKLISCNLISCRKLESLSSPLIRNDNPCLDKNLQLDKIFKNTVDCFAFHLCAAVTEFHQYHE